MREVKEDFTDLSILQCTVIDNHDYVKDRPNFTIRFTDLSNTQMMVNGEECEEFEFTFKGNSEHSNFASAFRMILEELNQERRNSRI